MTSFILFDLEWVATFFKCQMPEIISIGAVKLQPVNGKLVEAGRFQSYVRPQKAKRLNKRTIKITGIKPQDVVAEEDFPQVWTRFVKWMGDDYYLMTWGTEDIRTIIRNCQQYRMPLEWLRNYNDLQAEFGRLYRLQNQAGLMQALELLRLEPVGRHHSAEDDARNTAEIFKSLYGAVQLQRNEYQQIKRKHGPKPTPRKSRTKGAAAAKSQTPKKSYGKWSQRKKRAG